MRAYRSAAYPYHVFHFEVMFCLPKLCSTHASGSHRYTPWVPFPRSPLPLQYFPRLSCQRQLRQEAARKQLAVKIAKVKAGGGGGGGDGGEYGISWGFDEDAVAEDSDGEGEEGMEGEGGEVR